MERNTRIFSLLSLMFVAVVGMSVGFGGPDATEVVSAADLTPVPGPPTTGEPWK